jgi:hypothetical protein
MVAKATASGNQAKHLLFDSWFAYPAVMKYLLAKRVHTLCMLKVTKKDLLSLPGGRSPFSCHLPEDPQATMPRKDSRLDHGRDRGRRQGRHVSAKIVFVRDRRTKKWLALLSTDTSLKDQQGPPLDFWDPISRLLRRTPSGDLR